MGDYSRSQYWDNCEEAPDQNWKQEAMENAIRRYLSGPDSPLSPHPPYSPTPDDDPIHQHFFPTPNFQSMPLHYQRSFLDSQMYVRRVGQRTSGHISEYRDQIFHLSQAALCRELEIFFLWGSTPLLF
jgi:hypothetical protein